MMRQVAGMLLVLGLAGGYRGVAATYYVDGLRGNNHEKGLSAATAWKTLEEVNSVLLKAGDRVLFHRGQVFYGRLWPRADRLSFAAYGEGAAPVISGISELRGWTAVGNGVYEAPCPDCTPTVTLLTIDDTVKAMGRWPNADQANGGYLTITGHEGNTSITDSMLSGGVNWTGAEMVIKKNNWTLDRGIVTGQAGPVLNYTSLYGGGFDSQDGYGFFFQNSPATLDAFGEWYYDKAGARMRVYFGKERPGRYVVRTATIDTLVYLHDCSGVRISGIVFEGSSVASLCIRNAEGVTIEDCGFRFAGFYAVQDSASSALRIEGCTIRQTNNTAIEGYAANGTTIAKCTISNTGLLAGMGGRNGQPYKGIAIFGDGLRIYRNHIDSTGYMGIFFNGNALDVKEIVVDFFATVLDDGGGIYTFGGNNQPERVIAHNIVLNGIGSPAGTTATSGGACGIYADDQSSWLRIDSNTTAYCARAGVYLHNAHQVRLRGNTVYGNGEQLLVVHDAAFAADSIRDLEVEGNVFFSMLGSQFVAYLSGTREDFGQWGRIDHNVYARPYDSAGIIATSFPGSNGTDYAYYDLRQWSRAYGFDRHSPAGPHLSPYTIEKYTGVNIFSNGRFDSTTTGVFCLSGPGGCTVSWDGEQLDKGSAKIAYDGTPSPNASLGAYFSLGMVEAGKDYLVRWDLKGDNTSPKTFQVFVLPSGPNVSGHSLEQYFAVTPKKTTNRYLFHSDHTGPATLCFVFTRLDTAFWVDNVSVRPVVVQRARPADSMRLVYNAGVGEVIFPLDGDYRDGWNDYYLAKIRLSPLGSAALVRVASGVSIPPQPPVADIRVDTGYAFGNTYYLLDGEGSYDPEEGRLQYSWEQLAGPAQAYILWPEQAITPLYLPAKGEYRFRLTVTDEQELAAMAEVSFTNADLSAGKEATQCILYPDPVWDLLHVQLTGKAMGKVSMVVLDGAKKTMQQAVYTKDQDQLTVQLELGRLRPGLYFLQITEASGRQTLRPFLKL